MKPLLLCVLFFLLSFGYAQSKVEEELYLPLSLVQAGGGLHAASGEEAAVLWSNPALVSGQDTFFQVTGLQMHFTGQLFDIANVIIAGATGSGLAILSDPMVINLLTNFYAESQILGPVELIFVGDGIDFGLYNQTSFILSSAGTMVLSADVNERVGVIAGGAIDIPLPEESLSDLSVGIKIKLLVDGKFAMSESLANLMTYVMTMMSGGFMTEPFYLSIALGADAGVTYTFADCLTFGLWGKDLFTPTLNYSYATLNGFVSGSEIPAQSNGLYPLNLIAGVAYTPELGWLEKYIGDLKISVDYKDILGFLTHASTTKNIFLLFSAGVEFTVLDNLDLKVGLNEGLLAAGFGLNLGPVDFDLAMFGRELSREPGMNPQFTFALNLGLAF
jgi:hypothetical protein